MKFAASRRVGIFGVLAGVVLAAYGAPSPARAALPVQQIENTVGIQGTVENGVLDLSISRDDIGSVQGPTGTNVTFSGSFELNGDAFFQPLPGNRAFMNGDIPLKESETQPFISALLSNGLVFQAFHQHLPMHPQIWFVHFRGTGDPIALAQALHNAISTTSTPLPQSEPQNATSPLDPNKLAQILHGHASVGADGVVTVWVLRTDPIVIDHVRVNPQANVSTNIEFKPTGGDNADVVPDFSMTAHEITPVVSLMMNHFQWYQGCLYNQETDEYPQLYFDHMLKSGNAYDLAREIRQGLDLTNAAGSTRHGDGDGDRDDHR